jgi:hypothetical protein
MSVEVLPVQYDVGVTEEGNIIVRVSGLQPGDAVSVAEMLVNVLRDMVADEMSDRGGTA